MLPLGSQQTLTFMVFHMGIENHCPQAPHTGPKGKEPLLKGTQMSVLTSEMKFCFLPSPQGEGLGHLSIPSN